MTCDKINIRLCVVDDDPSVRRALKRLLGTVASDVVISASAQEFLNSFDPTQPICLILDVYLGGMSGIELYQHLTEAGHTIPVVFITAQDTEWVRDEVRKFPGAGFLRKPFDDQSLFDAIHSAID